MNKNDNKIDKKLKEQRKSIWSMFFFALIMIMALGFGIYSFIIGAVIVGFWAIIAFFAFISAFFNERKASDLLVQNKLLKEKLNLIKK